MQPFGQDRAVQWPVSTDGFLVRIWRMVVSVEWSRRLISRKNGIRTSHSFLVPFGCSVLLWNIHLLVVFFSTDWVIVLLIAFYQETLAAVLNHLRQVSLKADVNKMSIANLAVCFGPILLCPGSQANLPQGQTWNFSKHIELLKYILDIWPHIRGNFIDQFMHALQWNIQKSWILSWTFNTNFYWSDHLFLRLFITLLNYNSWE